MTIFHYDNRIMFYLDVSNKLIEIIGVKKSSYLLYLFTRKKNFLMNELKSEEFFFFVWLIFWPFSFFLFSFCCCCCRSPFDHPTLILVFLASNLNLWFWLNCILCNAKIKKRFFCWFFVTSQ